jgi:di/tricarboxylate transporter
MASLDRQTLHERYGLKPMPLTGAYFADRSQDVGMAEVVVPAESRLIGQTIAGLQLRTQYDLHVVGLRRKRKVHPPEFAERRLKAGDTLLLVGPWGGLRRLQAEGRDLVVLSLPAESDDAPPAVDRAPQATLALLVSVALMVSGAVPNVQAALIGCLLMGLFRCIDLESAYRAISWKNLVLIVGMLPFTLALERTGGADMAADALITLVGNAEPRIILASLFLLTVVLGLFIVNTANALLIIPIALAIADDLNASPYPFAMTIALAASATFMTPISPVNALVATAGNYGFGDFVRLGLPFTLLTMAVTVLAVPWVLPFN